jgi:hypothetical protein
MKMKLIDDFRVSKEARKVLLGSLSQFTITSDCLYVSKEFFLVMKKQSTNKDNLPDFESVREKQVDHRLTDSTLCLGPYFSEDR